MVELAGVAIGAGNSMVAFLFSKLDGTTRADCGLAHRAADPQTAAAGFGVLGSLSNAFASFVAFAEEGFFSSAPRTVNFLGVCTEVPASALTLYVLMPLRSRLL